MPVVAMAASAGGLGVLHTILGALPPDFPAAIIVLQHLDPHRPTLLHKILGRFTKLKVELAGSGTVLQPGVVYVAPPDQHVLVLADRTVMLSDQPRVHFVRPSADPLFASLAALGGDGTAVVLSGSGIDGSMSLEAVKQAGGWVIVQDELTAEHAGMPHAATLTGAANQVLDAEMIAPALMRHVASGVRR